MKNPLRKRYSKEIKHDFGKYLVIFLFLVMLIGLVSAFLVDSSSIETTFYNNFKEYNVEDGHITFTKELDDSLIRELESKGNITLYNLEYSEEDIDDQGTTLRIFKNRKEVNKTCIYSGELPRTEYEIAVDRLFANYNHLNIGDQITLHGQLYRISGFIALVDYGCLFENESDMMFNAINFGVAIMNENGYERLDSKHISYNYAWQFSEEYSNEQEARIKSEKLIDILEEVLKAYDTKIIQEEVDLLYDKAEDIQDQLKEEMEIASKQISKTIEEASINAFTKVKSTLSQEELFNLYSINAKPISYLDLAAKKQGTTKDALIAKELYIDEQVYLDLIESFEKMEDEADSLNNDKLDKPVINLDELDEGYENDMEYSLDSIHEVISKIKASGIYNTGKIETLIGDLEELMHFEFDKEKLLNVENYVLRVDSKAVNYCMDDMGSDRPMFTIFYYIMVVLLAFVFAIITSNTITKEAGVIGTLRASGYTKGELIRHYMFLPMITTILSAIIGNILGYTLFAKYFLSVYYNSFCLAPFQTQLNSEAFLITTVAPLLAMMIINYTMLAYKLRLSPIHFLRRDLTKKKKRSIIKLNKKIPFLTRFRLRIILQNIPAYITLFFGIFMGGVLLIFGLMFVPLLEDYGNLIQESNICEYQYVLKKPLETSLEEAEKYCLTSMDSTYEGYLTDEISIYGIEEDSKYILKDIPDHTVLISNGMAKKFGIKIGDTLTLKDSVNGKEKQFVVGGEYRFDAALCVFMNRDHYLEMFNKDADYFTGYFTNDKINDIDLDEIVTIITQNDYVKISNQLIDSLGGMMIIFKYFGVVIFLLLMYIMTKQIIEKNMLSISMTKILGFRNKEIYGLYLVITSIVVVISLLITIPLIQIALRLIFEKFLYMEMTGYLPLIVSKMCYIKMFILGVVSYVFVSFIMMGKINRIEKSEALKNAEF